MCFASADERCKLSPPRHIASIHCECTYCYSGQHGYGGLKGLGRTIVISGRQQASQVAKIIIKQVTENEKALLLFIIIFSLQTVLSSQINRDILH